MLKFSILGASDNHISMVLEILYSHYSSQVTVEIVKNQELTEKRHPYKISGINSIEVEADKWNKSASFNYAIGAITCKTKKIVFNYFHNKFGINSEDYKILIHKNSEIAKTSILGNGTIINPCAVLAPYSELGELVTINRLVSIGHHVKIGKFSTINPGVNIAGHCDISEGVTIGIGTSILDGITIGNNSIIGAGSLVIKDIPENVIAYGSPAKVIKTIN